MDLKPARGLFNDLTDKEFGRWTVVKLLGLDKWNMAHYLCRCECGTEKRIRGTSLTAKLGPSTSCGCYAKEVSSTVHTIHGMTGTKEYRAWRAIISRCENPNTAKYRLYGGMGVTVCKRWRNSFDAFFSDMGPAPSKSHSIDRFPNPDGNYEPSNCRWATAREQSGNRRTAVQLTHDGKTMCIAAWAREAGMGISILHYRLNAGWPLSKAISTPVEARVSRR